MQSDDSTYFAGPSGEIEAKLRHLLSEREATSDKLKRQVLTVQIRELKDQLILTSSPQPGAHAPHSMTQEDSGLFDGEIGRIETQLRDCMRRKATATFESHRRSLEREIESLVDLLRSPIIHENAALSIDTRRLWDMVRSQNLTALERVDSVLVRTLRDPVTQHSALHKAAVLGNVDLVNLLVTQKGCDLDAVCLSGQTPLHVAVQLENIEVARRLLELGADRCVPDNKGRTALSEVPRFILEQLLGDNESSTTSQSDEEKPWEIDPLKLEYGAIVGDGATAVVYAGCYNCQPVAIKQFSAIQRSEFNREVQILMQLDHPNLVRFIGATSKDKLRLVMELCTGGSLYELLHERRGVLSLPQILSVSKDVLAGLAYLHANKIIHMDLKSRNLLFQSPVGAGLATPRVKLADFGISRTNSCSHRPLPAVGGTWYWMSPETLLGDLDEISGKSDIFSVAVCLFEMLSGELPYASMEGLAMLPPVAIAIKVANGFRPDVSRITRSEAGIAQLIKIMERCWSYEPADRPSADSLLQELSQLEAVHCGDS